MPEPPGGSGPRLPPQEVERLEASGWTYIEYTAGGFTFTWRPDARAG
jgi:hypothetical protein